MPDAPEHRIPKDEGEHSGKVRLNLVGFDEQKIVSTQDIVAALDILPNSHLEGLKAIRYDPRGTVHRMLCIHVAGLRHDAETVGEYYAGRKLALIYEFHTKERFYDILFHEIGHHVHDQVLNDTLRSRWKHEIHAKNQHVTTYASESPQEGFAETYEWFVLHSVKLRMHYRSLYEFMKKEVFRDYAIATDRLHREVLAAGESLNIHLLQLQGSLDESKGDSDIGNHLQEGASCPKCEGRFKTVAVQESTFVDVCADCGGTWLDYGELGRLSRCDWSSLKEMPSPRTKPVRTIEDHVLHFPEENKCPKCRFALREVYFRPDPTIWIDICERCKGSYYDAGELVRALTHLGPQD